MDTIYLEFVYHNDAAQQLENLIDSDIRYEDEVAHYEWILCREPERLGAPAVIEGQAVLIFLTAQKRSGPTRLAVTYQVLRNEHYINILDVRIFP
jgi:hypothetical protein